MRNKYVLVVFILLFSFSFCIAQEFNSVVDVNKLLTLSAIQFEDSLIKKGFQFEKSEGNIFRYKKNASRIDYKMNPKELTYTFADRTFYLRAFSELETAGFKLIEAEEEIIVQNSSVKADHLSKDAFHVYLWNTTDGGATNKYSFKVTYTGTAASVLASDSKTTPNNQSKSDFSFSDFTEKLQKEIVLKKDPANSLQDSSGAFIPKPTLFNLSVGRFRFNPYSMAMNPSNHWNIQIGYQKSKLKNIYNRKKWLSDGGIKVDFGYMPGIEYTSTDNSTSLKMWKCYFILNQYTAVKLKSFDLFFQGGFFLNYNYGKNVSSDISASFWDVGFHFGEQIQKKIGRTPEGYPAMVLGLGFDQFIDVSGCYIGSLGVSIGF